MVSDCGGRKMSVLIADFARCVSVLYKRALTGVVFGGGGGGEARAVRCRCERRC